MHITPRDQQSGMIKHVYLWFLPSIPPFLSASATGLAPRPEQPQAVSMMQTVSSVQKASPMMQPAPSIMQPAPSMMQPVPSMMQPAPPMMQQPVDMEQSPSPPPLDNGPPHEHRVPPSLHTPSLQSLLEEVSLDKTLIAKVKEQLNSSSPAQNSPNREEHFLHQVGGERGDRSNGPCAC